MVTRAKRLLFAAASWSTVVCCSAHAEQGLASSSVSAERDIVPGTQRELEELAALQRGLVESGGNSVALPLPDLQAPGPINAPPVTLAPKAPQQSAEERRRRQEARNWLLNAMREPRSRQSSDTGQARDGALAASLSRAGPPQSENGEPTLDVVSEALRADGEDAEPESVRAGAPTVNNPLEAFLRAWMTPADYALLGAGGDATGGDSAMIPFKDGGLQIKVPFISPSPEVAAPVRATHNPYLPDMPGTKDLVSSRNMSGENSFGSRPIAGPSSVLSAPALAPQPNFPASTVPRVTAPTETRYQPPPSANQKYFPQLKRF